MGIGEYQRENWKKNASLGKQDVFEITVSTILWNSFTTTFLQPHVSFSKTNSERVKAVNLAFGSSNFKLETFMVDMYPWLAPVSRYLTKLTWGYLQFPNIWSNPL